MTVAGKIPSVFRLKDTRQIAIDGVRIRRVGISSLMLHNVVGSDSGLYTCRASNTIDSHDRTVAVHVAGKLITGVCLLLERKMSEFMRSTSTYLRVFVSVEPKLTVRPESKAALETADVEFECSSTGSPSPTVSWFKNGEAIIASHYFVIEPTRCVLNFP
ncbi:unnamed protein product [Cylicostephanus goldi]|uniref:Ig-like domain-containing protein n=1 Tax=Cylicostephanus goldi TaxID=71465 RepID=A0A3P6TJS2_CYLGO|nr:unnamed protein product [Cylicostephanus goldi]